MSSASSSSSSAAEAARTARAQELGLPYSDWLDGSKVRKWETATVKAFLKHEKCADLSEDVKKEMAALEALQALDDQKDAGVKLKGKTLWLWAEQLRQVKLRTEADLVVRENAIHGKLERKGVASEDVRSAIIEAVERLWVDAWAQQQQVQQQGT